MRLLFKHLFYILFFFSCSVKSSYIINDDSATIINDFNDSIDFLNVTSGLIKKKTLHALSKADIILNEILSIDDTLRTFENTMVKVDDLYNEVSKVWNIIGLLSSVHPSEKIRNECDENDTVIENYMLDLSLNESLYGAFLEYEETDEAKRLPIHRKRFLDGEISDFEKSGLDLTIEDREKLKKLYIKHSELSRKFYNNILSFSDTIFFDEKLALGLPGKFKDKHKSSNGSYAIDLSYPSYDAFMKYSASDSLRKLMRYKYLNIGSPENLILLDEILLLSKNIAEKLGYSSYAEYSIDGSMAKTPLQVWKFENDLRRKIMPIAQVELNNLLMMKREYLGTDDIEINDWDKNFYENLLLREKYHIDSEKVEEYFKLENVIKGFKEICSMLFDITFKEVNNPSVWHADVTMHEMFDRESGELLGKFYLDLYPRANKYPGAAEYTILSGKQVGNTYQIPVACLVCNFPPSTDDLPSLLPHDEVETFFHEFGHLIHDLLSKTELMSQSGTSVDMDFVEAPSQLLENYVWNKEVLKIFAKHYETGEIIPDSLMDRMILSKKIQSGNNALQQIFYGLLDLTFYDAYDVNTVLTTTEIVAKLQNEITLYPYFEGTHMQASFDHLLDYSASYYGYLWSEVYAEEMYSVFKEHGILNPIIGKRYREIILEKGGSEDPMVLIEKFIGRKPNYEAFYRSLGIYE
tara:strand:- start:177 stop:2255 length:2079 start_codon:yes stop_codon:yes gene_type:complete